MQIMPDIPEDKRGLFYWATPKWLTIHNREMESHNKGGDTVFFNRKTFTIRSPEGELIQYDSRKQAADIYNTTVAALSAKIIKARKRSDQHINFNGIKYILVEDEGGNNDSEESSI